MMQPAFSADLPIYRQVRAMVVAMVLDGVVGEGEAVPSVRQLAAEQQINPLTVSRAYQELVDEGVLIKRRGIGFFVAKGAVRVLLAKERDHFLGNEWPRIKERMDRLGIDMAALARKRN